MPRRSDLEKLISQVLEKAAPSSLKLMVPSYAFKQVLGARYEVHITRREGGMIYTGKTVREAFEDARNGVEGDEFDPDPLQPDWYRLSRIIRQIPRQVLREQGARYMAMAAEAKVRGDAQAHHHYAIADAFFAADEVLDFIETDENLVALPREPLAADSPAKEQENTASTKRPRRRAPTTSNAPPQAARGKARRTPA